MGKTGTPPAYRTAAGEIDVARLKQDVRVSQIAAMVVDLKTSGSELRGRCPFHDDGTPSFHVNDAKGLWFCFGCRRGGDVIALVQTIGGRPFVEACEWLMSSEWTCAAPHRSPTRRAAEDRRTNVWRAKAEWRHARFIEGTPTERYLASRGIACLVPGAIRHGEVPRFWTADGREGPRFPAMIATAQDVDGSVVGISRTFLDHVGRKARHGSVRLSLGQMRGCALRLGPPAATIMLAVGVEDALSLMLMFPGASVWSAFGDANLPHVRVPGGVERVVLCGDADDQGRAAVAEARTAFEARGIAVEAVEPHGGAKDFNEEWQTLHAS